MWARDLLGHLNKRAQSGMSIVQRKLWNRRERSLTVHSGGEATEGIRLVLVEYFAA